MTIFELLKNEIKQHGNKIKEIVLEPDIFTKRYFMKLVHKGFNVRWMNENEIKENSVCFIIYDG